MTQLGLGSYGVAWSIGVPGFSPPEYPMDAFDMLRFAGELGLKRVQYADNLPLDALTDDERARLRDEAAGRGIAIEVGTRGITLDHLHHYIDIAVYFGSPILRVVVDTKTDHPSPQEVVTRVQAALPALKAAGITLAIENHDRFKARALAGVIEAIGDPAVGICLDTVNSFGALEGPDVVVAALGPHVVNLHVKEFVVRRLSHNMGFEVTGAPAGQGMLDMPWLLGALHGCGRTFSAIVETWLSPLETMRATIELEQDWVRQSVRYLRTLIPD
ncbi:MAG: sugar phosphate isomerase/epimerase [Chloroflexi bacterium]|nr:sugar phosphate isomerase/epimerase [Chloroflexota bacterium]